MLRELTMHGASGSLAWGYRKAASLTRWTVQRLRDDETSPWRWQLRATVTGPVDGFALRQRPLLLSVPRRGGFFVWPVRELRMNDTQHAVTATLGPPEG